MNTIKQGFFTLLAARPAPHQIILLDNGSEDDSVEVIRQCYGSVLEVLECVQGFQKVVMWGFTLIRFLTKSLRDMAQNQIDLFSASRRGFRDGWWADPKEWKQSELNGLSSKFIWEAILEGERDGNNRM